MLWGQGHEYPDMGGNMRGDRDRSLLCLVWSIAFLFDAMSSYVIQNHPDFTELNPLISPIINATSLEITFLVLAPVATAISVAVVWRLPRQLLRAALLVAFAEFINGQVCWYHYTADVLRCGYY